jgi:hypothetical protein
MLQTNLVASLGTFTMLTVCILGMGFMIRFFIALTGEKTHARAVHDLRSKRIHSVAVGACEAPSRSGPELTPASPLVMGVVRIANALASNPGENGQVTVDRPHPIVFGARARASRSAAERRYRYS